MKVTLGHKRLHPYYKQKRTELLNGDIHQDLEIAINICLFDRVSSRLLNFP